MAVGFSPAEDELAPDPFTGGGTAVAPPPIAPVSPAPVLSPVGPIPADTPGLAPPTDQPGTVSPPSGSQPGATAALTPGANDADSLATPEGMPGPGGAPDVAPVLPPRPTRPPLTGDPAKDIEASLKYENALDQWHTANYAAATSQQNKISADAAAKDLALQKEEQQRRDAMRIQQEQERLQRQQAIDDAVKERMAVHGDIENAKFRGDPNSGRKIFATLLSGLGQAFSAAGGHPAENMAQKVINDRMDREYQASKDKLANANESVLQARYGYKDTVDNQRAALNDMDADFAAKHRLIADEAAAQMKARGVAPEMIAQSELVYGNEQKANQYIDQIHAREIEASRKNEQTQAVIDAKEAAANASNALADWRNRRTDHTGAGKGAGAGGTSKASAKAQKDELKDIENAAKKTTDVVMGSARSPGVKVGYESAVAVSNELRKALKSGDPDAMKIAVLHAQEQSTRFLTGAAPTQQTFELQHDLQGSPDALEAKIGGLLGSPTEARSYVSRMVQNIDAIARQRKEVMEAERGSLQTRLDSVVKSDEGKRRAGGIMDSLFGAKSGGGGAPERKQVTRDGQTATYEKREGHWIKVQ